MGKVRGTVGVALRAAVSVGALWLVFSKVNLAEVGRAFATMDLRWALAALASVYLAVAISAIKWWVLVQARGYTVSFWRLARHYFVGFFFNNFLPTSVGGDVVRAWDLGQDLDDAPEGAASVIAERLIASLGLGLTALIGLPFAVSDRTATVAVGVVILASLVMFGIFLVPSKSATVVRGAMGSRFEGVADWVSRTVHGVDATLRSYRASVSVLALSVVFQLTVALVNYCIFRALGAPVGLGEAIVYTSIVSAVTMVPVSISGHGIREAGYAYFFGLAGVGAAVAVTASLMFFVFVAVGTLPGALFFALDRRR